MAGVGVGAEGFFLAAQSWSLSKRCFRQKGCNLASNKEIEREEKTYPPLVAYADE